MPGRAFALAAAVTSVVALAGCGAPSGGGTGTTTATDPDAFQGPCTIDPDAVGPIVAVEGDRMTVDARGPLHNGTLVVRWTGETRLEKAEGGKCLPATPRDLAVGRLAAALSTGFLGRSEPPQTVALHIVVNT